MNELREETENLMKCFGIYVKQHLLRDCLAYEVNKKYTMALNKLRTELGIKTVLHDIVEVKMDKSLVYTPREIMPLDFGVWIKFKESRLIDSGEYRIPFRHLDGHQKSKMVVNFSV